MRSPRLLEQGSIASRRLRTTVLALGLGMTPEAASQVETDPFPALGARLKTAAERLHVPGFALVVLDGENVRHIQVAGIRDVGGEPVERSTAFYLASCTKPFVATAMMMAIESGELALDDPVQQHFARFELADEQATRETTIHDLLCHRAGLSSDPIEFLDAFTGEITEARFDQFLQRVRPAGAPSYSNLHYTLSGRILESATGDSWQAVLQKRIFEPLGMKTATCSASALFSRPNAAWPLRSVDDGFERTSVRKTDATMHAAGGVAMSIDDLERWLRFQLGRGQIVHGEGLPSPRLLSSDTVETMWRMHARLDEPIAGLSTKLGFGLGWMRANLTGDPIVEHSGGYAGSAALITILPDRDAAIACVANSKVGGFGLCMLAQYETVQALLGKQARDLLPAIAASVAQHRGEPVPSEPNREPLQLSMPRRAYVGAYAHRDWGTLEIYVERGALHARIGTLPVALESSRRDAFTAACADLGKRPGKFVVDGTRCIAIDLDLDENASIRFTRI